jgi:hypothetical protein
MIPKATAIAVALRSWGIMFLDAMWQLSPECIHHVCVGGDDNTRLATKFACDKPEISFCKATFLLVLGLWVFGSLGLWVFGSLGLWVLGLLGSSWVLGLLGSSWVLGHLGSWVFLGLLGSSWGPLGSSWAFLGLLGSSWVLGLLGSWVFLGLLGSLVFGLGLGSSCLVGLGLRVCLRTRV